MSSENLLNGIADDSTTVESNIADVGRRTSAPVTNMPMTIDPSAKEFDIEGYIVENSPLLIGCLNPDGSTRYVNRACEVLSEYSKAEIYQHGWLELVYPGEKHQQLDQMMAAIKRCQDIKDYELVMQTKSGGDRTVRWQSINRFNAGGELIEIIGLGKDITTEKQALADLEAGRARLAEAQRVAHIGSWEFAVASNSLWWSEESYRLFEIDPNDVSALDFERFLDAVHPDDRKVVKDCYYASVAQRQNFDLNYRILLQDRSIRHVHALSEHHYDDTGRPIRSVGTVRDITAQIEQQVELSRAQIAAKDLQEYNEHVIQNSPMFIVGVLPDGAAKYINDAGCKISGYSRAELIGQDIWRLLDPNEHHEQTLKKERLFSKNNRLEGYETTIKRKDGKARIISWTSVDRKNQTGELLEIICVGVDITELKQSQQELHTRAHYDGLTKLPNRLYLSVRLELAIEQAIKSGSPGALLSIDIDRFKDINDTVGHSAGDELLKLVAGRLTDSVRQHDIVARLGGDEFSILLPEIGTEQNASMVADKILRTFSQRFEVGINEFHLTPSVGVSLFPRDGETVEDLFKNTDIAMYNAKERGGNTHAYFSPALSDNAARRIRLEKNLRKALEHEQLTLYFQPQVNMKTGELIGAETLLRWIHPSDGFISPAEFIPIAEDTGLIIPIGDWVLEKACLQAKQWIDAGIELNRLAVNIAGPQITRGDLIASCRRALDASGLDPRVLELEVTEGFIMNDAEGAIDTLQQLRGLGVPMSIDDFGTGYSSLTYLKRLPLDQIKIDQSFVRDIPNDDDDIAITKTIIALGKNLGLSVLAEGVETAEQRDFLLREGCELAQGYLFYKPMPAEDFFQHFDPEKSDAVDRSSAQLSS